MKHILSKKNLGKVFCSVAWVGLVLTVACLSGCGLDSPKVLSDVDTAMGTVITQKIYLKKPVKTKKENGDALPTEEILGLVGSLERERISFRIPDAELARINEAFADRDPIAGDEPDVVKLSPQMEEILTRCLEISEASDGAFDITIGSVARLWNVDEWADPPKTDSEAAYPLPSESEIREKLDTSGYEKVTVKDHGIILSPGMSLDLGAVGKGIALDEILQYLKGQENVEGAVISAGGSILTYGTKPDGTAWNVGIVDPMSTDQSLGILTLTGQWCVSTSGDYERYVEVDGVRYHHIIDPETGYPARSRVKSVTVLTRDGFLSDALSTACFILGRDKGMELAEKYGAEALFVDQDGEVAMTEGMRQYFNFAAKEK